MVKTEYYDDGSYYEGQFLNGERDGHGRFYYENGQGGSFDGC